MARTLARSKNRKRRPLGRLIPSLLLLVFATLAGLGSFGMRRALQSMPSEETWRKVPAQVLGSGIEVDARNDTPFTAWVEYTYEHHQEIGGAVEGVGTTHTSRQVMDGGLGGKDYTDLWLQLRPFSAGGQVFAYLDPDNPARSVLLIDSGGQRVGVVVLALISAACLAAVVMLWRPRRRTGPPKGAAAIGTTFFFGMFLLGGLATLHFVSVPLWRAAFAVSWMRVPCTVIFSEVRLTVSHDDGRTTHSYQPDILFEYEVNGVTYRSNRYQPLRVSSSGRADKEAVVKAHPPGHRTECFVNTREPWEAVLDNRIGWKGLLTLFPLPFLLIGGFGLRWRWRNRTARATGAVPALAGEAIATDAPPAPSPALEREAGNSTPGPPASAELSGEGSAFLLQPEKGRGCAVFLLGGMALFWNGFLLAFVLLPGEGTRGIPWLGWLFLCPFFLVGVGFAVGTVYAALGWFNARFELECERPPFSGTSGLLRWRMKPSTWAPMPVKVVIKIRAERKVVQGSGKQRRTTYEVLWEQVVVEQADRYELMQGQGTYTLPARVEGATGWNFSVQAEVPGWPDVNDEYPFSPLRPNRGAPVSGRNSDK